MSDAKSDPRQDPYPSPAADPARPSIRHVPWWRWDISPIIGLGLSVMTVIGHLVVVPQFVALWQQVDHAVPAWAQWVATYGIYVAVLLGVMAAMAVFLQAQSADQSDAGYLGWGSIFLGLLGLLVTGVACMQPLSGLTMGPGVAPPTAPTPRSLLPSPR